MRKFSGYYNYKRVKDAAFGLTIDDIMSLCMIDFYEFRVFSIDDGNTIYEGTIDDCPYADAEVMTWDISNDGWLYFNV